MKGLTPLEDAQEALGITFPEEDLENYDTINGLLISRLDRIPDEKERPVLHYQGYRFAVTKVANKMIASVRVTRLPEEEAAEPHKSQIDS
jgi:putative hemolysin